MSTEITLLRNKIDHLTKERDELKADSVRYADAIEKLADLIFDLPFDIPGLSDQASKIYNAAEINAK